MLVVGVELAEGSVGLVVVSRPVSEVGAVVELSVPPVVPGSVSPPPEDVVGHAVASARVSRPMRRVDKERMRVLPSVVGQCRETCESFILRLERPHIEPDTPEVDPDRAEVPMVPRAGPRMM